LTNSKNAEKLEKSTYQTELAAKITRGLVQYRNEILAGQVKRHSLE
jgi:N-acetylmuramoyl-L-alanine amidase